MSDTPRTDAAANDWLVLVATSRQLERELAEMNRQRKDQQYLAITRGEELDRLRRLA